MNTNSAGVRACLPYEPTYPSTRKLNPANLVDTLVHTNDELFRMTQGSVVETPHWPRSPHFCARGDGPHGEDVRRPITYIFVLVHLKCHKQETTQMPTQPPCRLELSYRCRRLQISAKQNRRTGKTGESSQGSRGIITLRDHHCMYIYVLADSTHYFAVLR